MNSRRDASSSKNLKIFILEIVLGIALIVLGAVDASIASGAGVGVYILQALNKTGFTIPPLDFLILTVVLMLIGIVVAIKDLLKIF